MTETSIPTIGRIVHYQLNEQDVEQINRRRADAGQHMQEHRDRADGSQIHVGNGVHADDAFPAMVVEVWGSSVNLKVFLDGNDEYWATSKSEGDGQGHWHWPPRV